MATSLVNPRQPWIEMRRTISVGNIITIVVWLVVGIIALVKIQDQSAAQQRQIDEDRTEMHQIADIVSIVQQNTASETSMIESLRERLQRDESQLDSGRR